MKQHIVTGPFSLFFTNINTEMELGGHSHFAQLWLTWETVDDVGFPAFGATYTVIQKILKTATEKPFRGYTNEKVARQLFETYSKFPYMEEPEFRQWAKCKFILIGLELAVRGVPDRLDHADSFTRYIVEV